MTNNPQNTTNPTNSPVETTLAALASPDPQVRLAAALAAGASQQAELARTLVQRLGREDDFQVREALTWATVQLARHARTDVEALLDDPQPAVRQQAAHVLSKMGEPVAAERLAGVVADADPEVAVKAYRAAASSNDPAMVPLLVARLGDGDLEQRDALGVALGRLGAPAVPALVEALASSRSEVREHAADALGHLGGPDADSAAEALGRLVDDPSAEVRMAGVAALGELSPEVTVDALQHAAAGKDARVATVARHLLQRAPQE